MNIMLILYYSKFILKEFDRGERQQQILLRLAEFTPEFNKDIVRCECPEISVINSAI